MVSTRLAVFGMLGFIVGCGGVNKKIAAPMPDGVGKGAWNEVHENASEDMQCPIEQLKTTPLSGKEMGTQYNASFKVEGCGKEEIFTTMSGAMSSIVFSDNDLRKKVSFSFSGKCDEVSISFIDDLTRGVDACEQKIIYVFTNSGWVANTETE